MFLLAKTRKEELGKFFTGISFFIIITSFVFMAIAIIGGIARIMFHRMHREHYNNRVMEEPWRRGGFGHHRGMGRTHRWGERHEEMFSEHHRHKPDPKVWTDKMAEELNLSDEQKTKVLTVNTEIMESFGNERKKIEEQQEAKLKTILTNEQFQKYIKIKEERREKMKEEMEEREEK